MLSFFLQKQLDGIFSNVSTAAQTTNKFEHLQREGSDLYVRGTRLLHFEGLLLRPFTIPPSEEFPMRITVTGRIARVDVSANIHILEALLSPLLLWTRRTAKASSGVSIDLSGVDLALCVECADGDVAPPPLPLNMVNYDGSY